MKKSLLITLLLAILAGLAYFGYQYLQVSDLIISQPEVVTVEPAKKIEPAFVPEEIPEATQKNADGAIFSNSINAIHSNESNE